MERTWKAAIADTPSGEKSVISRSWPGTPMAVARIGSRAAIPST